ncbi:hypothetical protein IJD34_01895 [bacterium]|nr:hypothetical protein [bacterium]
MKKKLLGLLIAMAVGIPAYASIIVSPTKIEINANKIKNNYTTAAIEVKGENDRPVRFRAYPGYFEISNTSEMIMKDSSNSPHDLSKKIRFVPSEFTIPAGKSQKVRVNIAGIKTLPDGESRAVLYLEDVNQKEMSLGNTPNGIGAQLILKTRVGVPVYVDKGKFTKIADIETFNIVRKKDGLYSDIKVVSTGTNRVRYTGIVQIIQGKKLIDEYPLNGKVVGGNNSYSGIQKVKTDKIVESGEYTLRAILTYFDENNNRKNIKKDAILKITGEI